MNAVSDLIELAGDALHRRQRKGVATDKDSERIAGERLDCEHIDKLEPKSAVALHGGHHFAAEISHQPTRGRQRQSPPPSHARRRRPSSSIGRQLDSTIPVPAHARFACGRLMGSS